MQTTYYNALIEAAVQANGRPASQHQRKWGFQIHHIKPCCQFPGGRQDPCAHLTDNMVYLTHEQHLEAHRLLTLIHPSSNALKYAFKKMQEETPLRYQPETGRWIDPLTLPPVEQTQPAPAPKPCWADRNREMVVFFSFAASLWLSLPVKWMLPHGMKLLTVPCFIGLGFGIAIGVTIISKVWHRFNK